MRFASNPTPPYPWDSPKFCSSGSSLCFSGFRVVCGGRITICLFCHLCTSRETPPLLFLVASINGRHYVKPHTSTRFRYDSLVQVP
ncbi:hypothetical protein L1887_00960 [Cichorium endivia]|nr:hypothetical protein L1887_00960 [Cichorium endivia]